MNRLRLYENSKKHTIYSYTLKFHGNDINRKSYQWLIYLHVSVRFCTNSIFNFFSEAIECKKEHGDY